MSRPATYEGFAAWFGANYAGPRSLTVGDAMREFTSAGIPAILAWWARCLEELEAQDAEACE